MLTLDMPQAWDNATASAYRKGTPIVDEIYADDATGNVLMVHAERGSRMEIGAWNTDENGELTHGIFFSLSRADLMLVVSALLSFAAAADDANDRVVTK